MSSTMSSTRHHTDEWADSDHADTKTFQTGSSEFHANHLEISVWLQLLAAKTREWAIHLEVEVSGSGMLPICTPLGDLNILHVGSNSDSKANAAPRAVRF